MWKGCVVTDWKNLGTSGASWMSTSTVRSELLSCVFGCVCALFAGRIVSLIVIASFVLVVALFAVAFASFWHSSQVHGVTPPL